MKNKIDHASQLRLEKICKYFFQGDSQIKVLENISLCFDQNSTYALTGSSGVGKSTLIYLIAGLDTPTSGSIYYNDKEINKFNQVDKLNFLRNSIGLIFQIPSLIAELSVLENVMIKGLISGQSRSINESIAYKLLDEMGLINKSKSLPNVLSGGEQQRVAIARALFNKPAFLIADEPTAQLDSKNKTIVLELLLRYQKKYNMGLIIASHDLTVAQSMKEILELKAGQIHVSSKSHKFQNLKIEKEQMHL